MWPSRPPSGPTYRPLRKLLYCMLHFPVVVVLLCFTHMFRALLNVNKEERLTCQQGCSNCIGCISMLSARLTNCDPALEHEWMTAPLSEVSACPVRSRAFSEDSTVGWQCPASGARCDERPRTSHQVVGRFAACCSPKVGKHLRVALFLMPLLFQVELQPARGAGTEATAPSEFVTAQVTGDHAHDLIFLFVDAICRAFISLLNRFENFR
jgi:hypothetical protein